MVKKGGTFLLSAKPEDKDQHKFLLKSILVIQFLIPSKESVLMYLSWKVCYLVGGRHHHQAIVVVFSSVVGSWRRSLRNGGERVGESHVCCVDVVIEVWQWKSQPMYSNKQHQEEKMMQETTNVIHVEPVLKSCRIWKWPNSKGQNATAGLVFHQFSIKFISLFNKHGLLRYSSMHLWLVLVEKVHHHCHEQAARLVMARWVPPFFLAMVPSWLQEVMSSIRPLMSLCQHHQILLGTYLQALCPQNGAGWRGGTRGRRMIHLTILQNNQARQ